MCGIIGFFNTPGAEKKARAGLRMMRQRGKDGFGLASENGVFTGKDKVAFTRGILGHCLHSVVSSLPQPLKGKGIFAANSEVYNWQELKEKYRISARNDSELIFNLLESMGIEAIEELDGDYAFAYWRDGKVILARDIIGVKPIWYSLESGLAFASERKALIGYNMVEELNPRHILAYDLKRMESIRIERPFFALGKEMDKPIGVIKEGLAERLTRSVEKRIPEKKLGLLFSGGIDSSILALLLKRLGKEFTCYTAAMVEPGLSPPKDLESAKKAAAELGLDLKIKTIRLSEVEGYLKKVVPIIEDNNVVKVGVALTFYVACELAKKDGVKVILSGLGSEELFAGYERHRKSLDINKECLSGLLKIYERDTYRDDVVTMANNMELRVPFLDRELIRYSLSIPAVYKLGEKGSKLILRDLGRSWGLSEEIAGRPKRAAQYGSNFDKALDKLSRKSGTKSAYLKKFFDRKNLRLAALYSGGKDSTLALWVMARQNYEISCLVTMESKNPDSYMFHTPNIGLTSLQAEAMGIPILVKETLGKKEEELEDLKCALVEAKKRFRIQGIVTGAVFSTYQRDRIEKVADSLGLKLFSPLWHMDQALLMRYLLDNGFEFILGSIAADGLDQSWLGRQITYKDLDRLIALNKRNGINIAFEGGEAESFVLDAPLFKKRIGIKKSDTLMEDRITGRYLIKGAHLMEKK